MKNKIVVLALSLLGTQFLIAQDDNVAKRIKKFNNDTAVYIKQYIVERKNMYVGEPLDSLLKDLPLVIRYLNGDVPRNRFICPATTFCFASYQQTMNKIDRKEPPLLITITWATPLDNRDLPGLGLRVWGGEWTPVARDYYKTKIIGNIETMRYD